jgi:hypothetical protein
MYVEKRRHSRRTKVLLFGWLIAYMNVYTGRSVRPGVVRVSLKVNDVPSM